MYTECTCTLYSSPSATSARICYTNIYSTYTYTLYIYMPPGCILLLSIGLTRLCIYMQTYIAMPRPNSLHPHRRSTRCPYLCPRQLKIPHNAHTAHTHGAHTHSAHTHSAHTQRAHTTCRHSARTHIARTHKVHTKRRQSAHSKSARTHSATGACQSQLLARAQENEKRRTREAARTQPLLVAIRHNSSQENLLFIGIGIAVW